MLARPARRSQRVCGTHRLGTPRFGSLRARPASARNATARRHRNDDREHLVGGPGPRIGGHPRPLLRPGRRVLAGPANHGSHTEDLLGRHGSPVAPRRPDRGRDGQDRRRPPGGADGFGRTPVARAGRGPGLAPPGTATDRARSPTVFFIPGGVGGEGEFFVYARLARHVGPEHPFYGLKARSAEGREASPDSVEEMASDYLREIRSRQPDGPFIVVGECAGGVVAYEIAQQLRAEGRSWRYSSSWTPPDPIDLSDPRAHFCPHHPVEPSPGAAAPAERQGQAGLPRAGGRAGCCARWGARPPATSGRSSAPTSGQSMGIGPSPTSGS